MTLTPTARRRWPALALALPAFLPLLAGCGKEQTVVGKWQTDAAQPGAVMHTEFDFRPDGKETMSFQQTGGTGAVSFQGSGTYTVSGSHLTQNITSVTSGGKPVSLPPGTLNQPKTSAFTLDGDNLTLTDPDSKKSVTFTRIKG